jgi:hypothetical protein
MSADGGRQESAWAVATRLYRDQGMRAFWDGLGPKLIRAVVNHATTFAVFEATMSAFAQGQTRT